MINKLRERRAAVKASLETLSALAEGETRGFTDVENGQFDAGLAEIRQLDERITELQEAETREALAAAHRVETGSAGREDRASVSEPNPVYRKGDNSASYFRDLFQANMKGDPEARGRLVSAQETRALSTSAGAGGTFAPPAWLVDDYVKLARAGRVGADLARKQVLPSGVSSVNLPKVATGTTVGVTQTQNTAVSNTDLTTTSVSSGITTISGQQVISLQLLEQSGIPFDDVILSDLALAYATDLDVQFLTGSGINGQFRGLTTAGTTVTYTTTTPAAISVTAANSFYSKIVGAKVAIATARFLPGDTILMTPARWGWLENSQDANGRPLVVPNGPAYNQAAVDGAPVAEGYQGTMLGLPVYVDPNIPSNLGVGTNQDEVFVLRRSDLWLWETALQSASFDATYANQNSILFRVLGYAAFIPDRYSASVQVISGTGLVQPTF